MPVKRKYTKDEINEIASLYKEYQSTTKVAEKLKMYQVTVWNLLNRHHRVLLDNSSSNIANKNKRKYTIDDTYFENIDTSNKAYWLGFLYGDGYNNEDTGYVSICYNKKDHILISEFLKEVNSNTKSMKVENDVLRVVIWSRKLSQDLARWGCVQRKTYILSDIPSISEPLISHFIRGLFDADGCISVTGKYDSASLNFTGAKLLLEKVNSILNSFLERKRHVVHSKKCREEIGSLWIYKKSDLLKVKDYLYRDAQTFLQRKYDIFQKVKYKDGI